MDIAKTAAIKAGLPDTVAGVQLNRFCASGLEAVNVAAQKVASGWEDLVLAGGVESMSRVPMGSDGGAWALDPETNYDTSFIPQGISADLIATIEEFSREDVDAYAARSQQRAAAAEADGRFADAVIPVKDLNDNVVLDHEEFIRPNTTVDTLGGLKPSFAAIGEMGGFDAVALQKYHWVEKIEHVHTPGKLVRDRRRRLAADDRKRAHRQRAGDDRTRADPRHRAVGRGSHDHAHRPRAGEPQGAGEGRSHRR
jgi:acetyl-CoA C-acetyltransferase